MFPLAMMFPEAVRLPVTLVLLCSSMVPVPFALTVMLPFVIPEVIDLLLTSRFPPNWGVVSSSKSFASAVVPYNSEKLSLILSNAVLNGSPVPSFAVVPILIVCCAIF